MLAKSLTPFDFTDTDCLNNAPVTFRIRCNIEYPPKFTWNTNLAKSSLFIISNKIENFTEQGNFTAATSAKYHNDWTTGE